jgi:anti-sigma regulatory factor (Ser/Thr protein kinase)
MQTTAALVHTAFFYSDDGEYLDEVLPFLRSGIELGEPVLVAVPAVKTALLRDALGADREQVEISDMGQAGRNPANTFALFAAALSREHRDRRIWVVAEPIWPGRTREEYPACVQNEALYNLAFAAHNLVTLCPYDAARLPVDVLADARRTHPSIRRGGRDVPCPEYAWQQAYEDYNRPLFTDPAAVSFPIGEPGDLAAARSFASGYAEKVGLAAERMGDLNIVVTELATNSLKYTGGGCLLSMWVHDGTLLTEMRDGGRLDDPLAGRRPARDDSPTGRGLLLVNALAGLVRMHTSPAGTTIQVHLPLSAPDETPRPD